VQIGISTRGGEEIKERTRASSESLGERKKREGEDVLAQLKETNSERGESQGKIIRDRKGTSFIRGFFWEEKSKMHSRRKPSGISTSEKRRICIFTR